MVSLICKFQSNFFIVQSNKVILLDSWLFYKYKQNYSETKIPTENYSGIKIPTKKEKKISTKNYSEIKILTKN